MWEEERNQAWFQRPKHLGHWWQYWGKEEYEDNPMMNMFLVVRGRVVHLQCESLTSTFESQLCYLSTVRSYPGIFLTQGLNPGLWHFRQFLYPLSPYPNKLDPFSYLYSGDPDAGKYWRQEEKETTEDWDGRMASPTQLAWVWASSRSWWWTREPGMLQSMGLQRLGHLWATELNWEVNYFSKVQ